MVEEVGRAGVEDNLSAEIEYVKAHGAQLRRMTSIATSKILSGFIRRPRGCGLEIKVESMSSLLTTCQELLSEHLAAIGEHPVGWMGKNLGLLCDLESAGNLQVRIARANGRAFGYLITLLAPSLVSPQLREAIHTATFASESWPGAGVALQRDALVGLREAGIDKVFWRDGIVASGGRMGKLYERFGARPDGQLYSLELQ